MAEAGWYLKEWRDRAGLTMEDLAALVHTSAGYLNDLEKGKRRFNQDWLEKFAAALEIEPVDLLRRPGDEARGEAALVPLVGYVGAGAEAHFYAEGDENLDFVEAPEGSTPLTRCALVRGESLGPLFEQWLVFYDDVRDPVTPDLIGKLCIVGLPNDKVLVKRLRKAAGSDLYHLESNTEGTLYDQEVRWAAKVKTMTPR